MAAVPGAETRHTAPGDAAAGDHTRRHRPMQPADQPPARRHGCRAGPADGPRQCPPRERRRDRSADPPGTDLAYGAFQRGFYLSAFGLAIPRAEAGDTAAQTLLGLIYEGGYGVPRDPVQAVSWYQFAADGGDPKAQFALGMMYLDGRGVAEDRAKAADYFEKAAGGGDIAATYNLALLYLEGKVRPQDLARAAQLFEQAAQAGNPDAQYVLAQLDEEGRGVPEDQAAATKWFAEAARLGHIPAEVEYAIRLFNGVGIAAERDRRGRMVPARRRCRQPHRPEPPRPAARHRPRHQGRPHRRRQMASAGQTRRQGRRLPRPDGRQPHRRRAPDRSRGGAALAGGGLTIPI